MAKAKPTSTITEQERKTAARAIRAITGCGVNESLARLKKLSDQRIQEIAQAESDGNRAKIPPMITPAG